MTKEQKAKINKVLMEISDELDAIYEETMSNEELSEERQRELDERYMICNAKLDGIMSTMWRLGYLVTSNITTNGKYQIVSRADDE